MKRSKSIRKRWKANSSKYTLSELMTIRIKEQKLIVMTSLSALAYSFSYAFIYSLLVAHTTSTNTVSGADIVITKIMLSLTFCVSYIKAVFGVGLLAMKIRLIMSVVRVRMLTIKGVQEPEPKCQDYMHEWAVRTGVMRYVGVY